MGEHGEQQGIQIAGDVPPVLGPEHLDIRIVGLHYPRKGLLLELQKLDGLVGVAPGEVGTEREADDVLGDLVVVELLEALGYGFGLFTVSVW